MEQMATPGSILITPGVLRLADGHIQLKSLGPLPIKGLTAPVEVYEVTGAGPARTRLQAAAARGLTRFVGRDAEIHALYRALRQAGAAHGQVVAAVGEAGVGKSRLLYEFLHAPHTQGWLVLEGASASYGKATPYYPIIDLLKRYWHLAEPDDSRTIRAKVTGQVLAVDDTLQESAGPNSGHSHRLPCRCGVEARWPQSAAIHDERGASGAPPAQCDPSRRRETPASRCQCRVHVFSVP
jgi:AAA ATPase domain